MYRVNKIDLPTVALYSFMMLFILSLLFMLPFGLILSIIGNSIPDMEGMEMGFLSFFSGVFLLVIPIGYAVFGTIINVIIVLCYNLLSSKLGGIKIDLKKIGQLDVVD